MAEAFVKSTQKSSSHMKQAEEQSFLSGLGQALVTTKDMAQRKAITNHWHSKGGNKDG